MNMAMRSGLFNSETIVETVDGFPRGDRAELADFFAKYFSAFIGNGVYPNPSTNFQVMAYDQLTLRIDPGLCFINGYFGWDTEAAFITLEPDTAKHAYRIVLRLSLTTRDIVLAVLTDDLTLTRTESVWEIALADVSVPKNAVSVTQNNVKDLRLNGSLCGIVHGVVEQLDTTTLGNQLNGWIESYMAQTTAEYNAFLDYMARLRASGDSSYQALATRLQGIEQQAGTDYAALLDYFASLREQGTLEQQSFTAWLTDYKQKVENDVRTWFETVKGILGEDAAGQLLLLIQELQAQQPTELVANIPVEQPGLHPAQLYSVSYGYGIGGFGDGGFGGGPAETTPGKFVFHGANGIDVYAVPRFHGPGEVTGVGGGRYMICFEGQTENLILQMQKQ